MLQFEISCLKIWDLACKIWFEICPSPSITHSLFQFRLKMSPFHKSIVDCEYIIHLNEFMTLQFPMSLLISICCSFMSFFINSFSFDVVQWSNMATCQFLSTYILRIVSCLNTVQYVLCSWSISVRVSSALWISVIRAFSDMDSRMRLLTFCHWTLHYVDDLDAIKTA